MRLADGGKRTLKEADFGSIHEGLNEDVVIVGRVVGIVPNPEAIPLSVAFFVIICLKVVLMSTCWSLIIVGVGK